MSTNVYINWLAKRLADPSTSTREYVDLRNEWNQLVFAQNQVNHMAMMKHPRVVHSAFRVPDYGQHADFADTIDPATF
jgi:hypothetical protein